MQIELRDEVARSLEKLAHQAGFESIETYLTFLAEDQPRLSEDPTNLSYKQWGVKFWEFVARQQSRNPNFDDSRESIYLDS